MAFHLSKAAIHILQIIGPTADGALNVAAFYNDESLLISVLHCPNVMFPYYYLPLCWNGQNILIILFCKFSCII